MADPLKNRRQADAKFKEAKKAAARIRMEGSRKETSLGGHHVIGKIADAVEDGAKEIKIGGETYSLDTPDKIAKMVEDIKNGKFK